MIMYTKAFWGYEENSVYNKSMVKNALGTRKSTEVILFRLSKSAIHRLTTINDTYRDNIVHGKYIFSPSYHFGPDEFDLTGVYIPGVEPGTWWWSNVNYDWIKFKMPLESKAMRQFREVIVSEYPEVIPDIKNPELNEIIPFEFGKDDI